MKRIIDMIITVLIIALCAAGCGMMARLSGAPNWMIGAALVAGALGSALGLGIARVAR